MLSNERIQQICNRVAFKWQASVPADYAADLRQTARLYELAHPNDPHLIGNIYQYLDDCCASWAFQTARADNQGLRVLRKGKVDVSWLVQTSPGSESRTLASLELARLWNRSTEAQRMAMSCLALADVTPNGGIRPGELSRFGIPSTRALGSRLAQIRKKGHA